MNELLVPLAAAAFWAGLVVAGTGGWSPRLLAWAALAGGLLMLGLGAWVAPRAASGLGPD